MTVSTGTLHLNTDVHLQIQAYLTTEDWRHLCQTSRYFRDLLRSNSYVSRFIAPRKDCIIPYVLGIDLSDSSSLRDARRVATSAQGLSTIKFTPDAAIAWTKRLIREWDEWDRPRPLALQNHIFRSVVQMFPDLPGELRTWTFGTAYRHTPIEATSQELDALFAVLESNNLAFTGDKGLFYSTCFLDQFKRACTQDRTSVYLRRMRYFTRVEMDCERSSTFLTILENSAPALTASDALEYHAILGTLQLDIPKALVSKLPSVSFALSDAQWPATVAEGAATVQNLLQLGCFKEDDWLPLWGWVLRWLPFRVIESALGLAKLLSCASSLGCRSKYRQFLRAIAFIFFKGLQDADVCDVLTFAAAEGETVSQGKILSVVNRVVQVERCPSLHDVASIINGLVRLGCAGCTREQQVDVRRVIVWLSQNLEQSATVQVSDATRLLQAMLPWRDALSNAERQTLVRLYWEKTDRSMTVTSIHRLIPFVEAFAAWCIYIEDDVLRLAWIRLLVDLASCDHLTDDFNHLASHLHQALDLY